MSQIEQSTTFLGDVLNQVRRGRLVPAAFQRPYRWQAADVEELWASIQARCPVGIFLIWQPDPRVAIGPLARTWLGPISVDPDARPALILDGQNRLATYAWSMQRPDDPRPPRAPVSEEEAETWYGDRALVADTLSRTVRFVPRAQADAPHLYAPGIVGDIPLLNRTVRARFAAGQVDDDGLEWLDRLGENLRQTRTVVTTLVNATPEEAFHHFRRIMRAGVPMSDADLARTLGLAESLFADLG